MRCRGSISRRRTPATGLARMFVTAGAIATAPAHALQFQHDGYTATVEGFANSVGGAGGGDGEDSPFAFGEARVLVLADTQRNLAFGPRLTYRAFAGSESGDATGWGERSLIALGSWGRFEIGKRRGLPDVLTGYAPNNYQFVSAEYGPASGPSLDPDGGLQVALLRPQLREQIGPLSSLGITAAFFADESPKAIYVLPKARGFLGGVSYAPNVDRSGARFDDLVQTGLSWENYWDQNVLRVGGTYTYASGQDSPGAGIRTDDLHSLSAGIGATLVDKLSLGASFTYNGATGLSRGVQPTSESAAYGFAFSAGYNTGPWTLGAFAQIARSAGDPAVPGDDELDAVQLGASYRASTHARLFAALYRYRFDDEGGRGSADDRGTLALAGLRLNF